MSSLAAALVVLAALGCGPPQVGVGAVIVNRRPPGDRIEIVGVAPRAGLVWQRGYWSWSGGDYAWVAGQWVAVAPGYRSWVPGRWHHSRQGWFFVKGHWR